jgi:LAO/AO transport system kinase
MLKQGIEELFQAIKLNLQHQTVNDKRFWLLAEKAYYLIQQKKMASINKEELKEKIEAAGKDVNLYSFIKNYTA